MSVEGILNIVSSRHSLKFAWRNFPKWHRERLTQLIKCNSIPEIKLMIDIIINRVSLQKLNAFWDYRGPNMSLRRTDSMVVVERNHFQPVPITNHNFEVIRRTHQTEVYECLCKKHLSIRLRAENPRFLRLKTYLAGLCSDDIRESIEKAMIQIVRRLIP